MILHTADIAVLVVYFLLMLGLGVYFSRTNNSTEQYFLGGRNFSGLGHRPQPGGHINQFHHFSGLPG